MIERVRAILVTPADTMLLIKRVRPGIPPYWVFPGGGVEPTDETLEAALHREIHEELAGRAKVVKPFHVIERDDEREHFYLTTIEDWSFDDRNGPEFSEAGRGEYYLDEVPLTIEAIDDLNLKPDEAAAVLRDAIVKNEVSAKLG
ncbi:NUDIX domain-containing protein [Kribbella sp. VKM Ac-2527]|uniref:NUDIX domain-containing protein n=1 Tax=Kribbella caucasensis TaxID=2512215 RepID=A0A4R6IY50_9ACTN|nr:NUDIX domain-containing protein [Kribbella sp. VKM Ac-2527]TDO27357.1 NUDIX domain-containing protein [Kribbella sp. VKM Ac-2527]